MAAFQMYKAAYGDLKVPSRFVVPAMPPWPEAGWGLKLGQRVAAIRATGKYIHEDEGRRKVLDEMGFLWRLRAPSDNKKMDGITFDQIYDALVTYKKLEVDPAIKSFSVPGNFVVPNCDPWPESTRGLPLGKKIPTVRSKAYLKANPGATEKLKSVGLELDGKAAANDSRFALVYNALVRYKELNGDLLVPQPFVVPEDSDEWQEEARGLRLGARVNAIRSQGTFVKTNPERRKQLDKLGFVWEPPPPPGGRKRGRKKKVIDEALQGPAPPGMLDAGLPAGGKSKDGEGASAGKADFFDGLGADGPAGMESLFGPASVFGGGSGEDPFKFGREEDKVNQVWGYADEDEESEDSATKEAPEDVYRPPMSFDESIERATQMAIDVGVVSHITEDNRVIKKKREANIPWFNDDFGGDFVFEDVVEALTVYKGMYGNFTGLDDDQQFVIPEPSASPFPSEAGVDVEASARAAAAIAAAERDGGAKSGELIEAEILRMEREMQSESADAIGVAEAPSPPPQQFPEHLAGMKLGSLVRRIRDGSLEVKHLPERKALLDAIDFDWGDPKYFIDIPFDKAMCAMYAYYLIRGDMMVYEDFVMLEDEPWPKALAGFELGNAVTRIRQLQNFFEAYHPDKVRLLRMVEFVWFPELALPLDPDAPLMTEDEIYFESFGHPFYKMELPPVGLMEKIVADGPRGDPEKISSWYKWEFVQDYWKEQAEKRTYSEARERSKAMFGRLILNPEWALKIMNFPKLADEHRERFGPSMYERANNIYVRLKEAGDLTNRTEAKAFWKLAMKDPAYRMVCRRIVKIEPAGELTGPMTAEQKEEQNRLDEIAFEELKVALKQENYTAWDDGEIEEESPGKGGGNVMVDDDLEFEEYEDFEDLDEDFEAVEDEDDEDDESDKGGQEQDEEDEDFTIEEEEL